MYKKQPLPHREPTQAMKSLASTTIFYKQFRLQPKQIYKKKLSALARTAHHYQRQSCSLSSKLTKTSIKGRIPNCPMLLTHKSPFPPQEGFLNRGRKHLMHSKQSKEQLPHFPCFFAMEKKMVNGLLMCLAQITSIC